MPAAMIADGAIHTHPSTCDTPSGALTGDAVDLISALWQPRFPSADLVDQAAALLPKVQRAASDSLAEGPRPYIRIGPGVVEVRSQDYARRYRSDERAVRHHEVDVDQLAQYLDEHDGEFPADPIPSRVITEWSQKSRNNMTTTLGQLDFTPMFTDRTRIPALVTLTYPGDWLTVAPTGRAVKDQLKAFRKRYERAWREPLYAVWKLEFQRRGAPHVHLLMVPPHGHVDGQPFREWLSSTWAAVVNHPDQEQYARHVRAGTGVDYSEGLRASDPKRVGVYFSKHSTFKAKEYQHIVPEEWSEPGTTPGRFWGYWTLRKHVAVVEVDQDDATLAGRTLRRWSDAKGVTREVTRPRVRGGRAIPKYPDVIGLAGAYLLASRPEPKYRKTRMRARRMRNNRGFVMVNDGAKMAVDLARVLFDRHASKGERLVGLGGPAQT